MYKIVSIISFFIRQFYLPNPYVKYFDIEAYADIFNIIVGGIILHIYAYFLTSCIYDKYKHSSWVGSFWYCVNYILNTYLINTICYKYPNFDMLNIILVAFIINFIIWMSIKFIKNKFEQEINFFS
ncbi:MAG: hypothetical protein ACI4VH_07755 [Clostridia bacterium]